MRKETVLVVDDEVMVREMVREMLDAEGYQATAADSARSALHLAQAQTFDVLVADIRMPEMDGIALVQELRHVIPDVVPILITGYASVATARQAVQEGVYDYLIKPFDRIELTAAVESALVRKRLTDENARLKGLVGLLQVSQAVAASSEYSRVLDFILHTAIEQTRSMCGSVLLFDAASQGVTMGAAIGPWDWTVKITDAVLSRGVAPLLAEIGQGLLLTDREQHPLPGLSLRHLDTEFHISDWPGGEIVLLPLEADHEIAGILAIVRQSQPKLLSEGDLELMRILGAQVSVAVKSQRSLSQMEVDCLACLSSMASLVDDKSPYTTGHMARVAQLSRQLARRLRLADNEVETISLAASLHDLGKMSVDTPIIDGSRDPAASERDLLRRHAVVADEVLARLPFLTEARTIIRHHHERLDGGGYPDGLVASEMTPGMHIVILANAYDNLTSGTAGRPALAPAEAILVLQEEKGTRFDPETTDRFIDILAAG